LQTDSAIFFLMFVTGGAVLLLYASIFLFAASHSEVIGALAVAAIAAIAFQAYRLTG
jgi:hypothetical protein